LLVPKVKTLVKVLAAVAAVQENEVLKTGKMKTQ
jgi:hypothetical protein